MILGLCVKCQKKMSDGWIYIFHTVLQQKVAETFSLLHHSLLRLNKRQDVASQLH